MTGSGKSAIYQVPAVLLPKPVIVISPLIALQHDQIAALEKSDAAAAVDRGDARYVFLGPEQLMKDDVMKRLAATEPHPRRDDALLRRDPSNRAATATGAVTTLPPTAASRARTGHGGRPPRMGAGTVLGGNPQRLTVRAPRRADAK
ncbi:hypothetical protein H7J88_25915 [Mycolicibacterium flavescens]|uniref:DEAD/DEAH box helicase domain-containing protein n=1 Tax=Mycolicibacterium flavescens TaxID=1776 RepID=A0A1E3RC69_MYCFV|nr:hypothetical protein [Mycolicibacterium flavescens]ODQ87498.1 hypothetical protein BHQ18_23075 [Mycolicibacterium flavescens]